MFRAIFWVLAHNCAAHPVLGLARAAQIAATCFHDWTAARMAAADKE
jgi:hypothetical protein